MSSPSHRLVCVLNYLSSLCRAAAHRMDYSLADTYGAALRTLALLDVDAARRIPGRCAAALFLVCVGVMSSKSASLTSSDYSYPVYY